MPHRSSARRKARRVPSTRPPSGAVAAGSRAGKADSAGAGEQASPPAGRRAGDGQRRVRFDLSRNVFFFLPSMNQLKRQVQALAAAGKGGGAQRQQQQQQQRHQQRPALPPPDSARDAAGPPSDDDEPRDGDGAAGRPPQIAAPGGEENVRPGPGPPRDRPPGGKAAREPRGGLPLARILEEAVRAERPTAPALTATPSPAPDRFGEGATAAAAAEE